MKTWKQGEKTLTTWLNEVAKDSPFVATRESTGQRGEAVEDISFGPLSIEMKSRQGKYPKYIEDWVAQATRNAPPDTFPIVVWHPDRTKYGDELAIMPLNKLIELIIKLNNNNTDYTGYISIKELLKFIEREGL